MKEPDKIYASRRFEVTQACLVTPRQTFILRDIDHVECRRPLFAATLPVAVCATAIGARFADLLHADELFQLIGWPALVSLIASQIGVLRLHSLSIRNEAVWGFCMELNRVRRALEGTMRARHDPAQCVALLTHVNPEA